MDHRFVLAAIVLFSVVALAHPKMWKGYGNRQSNKGYRHRHSHMHRDRYCYPNAQPGDKCDVNKRCAWNRSECPEYANCHLICTDNPYKFCYGAEASDTCSGGGFECWPDHTGQLTCIDTTTICGKV